MSPELEHAHADGGKKDADQQEIPQTEHRSCVGAAKNAGNPSTEALLLSR